MAKSEVQWETVHRKTGEYTERLPVPSGWIYRSVMIPWSEDLPSTVSMVFVPDDKFQADRS